MAKRNMEQTAKKTVGKIPTAYDISVDELYRLIIDKDRYNAIVTAFRYGFALGTRARDKKRVGCL